MLNKLPEMSQEELNQIAAEAWEKNYKTFLMSFGVPPGEILNLVDKVTRKIPRSVRNRNLVYSAFTMNQSYRYPYIQMFEAYVELCRKLAQVGIYIPFRGDRFDVHGNEAIVSKSKYLMSGVTLRLLLTKEQLQEIKDANP